jgi:nickel/cobalt exporter
LEKQDKDILKLSKLCQHWADHNESHKENFSKWRNIAISKGLNTVVENLNKAIEMLDKCNEYLLAAYNELL